MGRAQRRHIFIALGFLLLVGIAIHLRLWAIHRRISSNDSQLLRQQFDLANREAMDESAEWRRRFDLEFDKAAKCSTELEQMKKATGEKTKVLNKKMEMLQKENVDLLERVESLKQELESEKLKCSLHNM
ncbi:uncharacterized protein LOC121799014 isoform X1 [Salvia splendens]|uniref:uncharacterized protein LOC121799014 isoform X1 n=1 Tax=Salvia splendens TaxID=180675 RepID=UPI001104F0F0|nr:uncharacterized protein LOC121799014 isoform X1 [Salvia splendens]